MLDASETPDAAEMRRAFVAFLVEALGVAESDSPAVHDAIAERLPPDLDHLDTRAFLDVLEEVVPIVWHDDTVPVRAGLEEEAVVACTSVLVNVVRPSLPSVVAKDAWSRSAAASASTSTPRSPKRSTRSSASI